MDRDPSKEFESPFLGEPDTASHVKRYLLENTVDSPDLTGDIMAQLAADRTEQPVPCQYDFEFISAYFDGELPCEANDPTLAGLRIQAFEKHLPQCPPCNVHLGQLFEMSEACRSYFYRLEEACSPIDLAPAVIQLFTASRTDSLDETVALPSVGCGLFEAEALSAAVDQELPPEQWLTLEIHLSQCNLCQAAFEQLIRLGQHLRQAEQNLTNEPIPNFWPEIAARLQETPAPVVPMQRHLTKKTTMAMASAAAALLLLVTAPSLLSPPPAAPGAFKSVNIAALEAAMIADDRETARREVVLGTDTTVQVNYQTPEAYLFSEDADSYTEDILEEPMDVSAVVLGY